jgi:hypothetical protein
MSLAKAATRSLPLPTAAKLWLNIVATLSTAFRISGISL